MNTLARFALTTALTLVFTGITAHSATAEHTPCTLLGTVGTPEGASDRSSVGLEVLPPADIALPAQVYFRTTAESFNRRWSFAVRDGRIFVKDAAEQEDWHILPLPGGMDGRISGVSADDDEVMAIDRDRRFFTMDHALSAPRDWNWSSRYGTPLWTGPGNDTAADHTLETLAAPSPYTYTERSDRGWMATIDAFDIAVTPTLLRLDFGGDLRLDLILHTVDGLRQMPQQRGISDQPRHLDGTIEVPAAIANSLVDQPEPIRHFITDHLNGRRFTDTDVTVTA